MGTRCVVFDFDGTLVQSNEIKRQAFYEVVKNIADAKPLMDEILRFPKSGTRFEVFAALVASVVEV